MCLSTIYYEDDSEKENPIAENVTHIHNEGTHLILTDLFGADTDIDGTIEHIDLVRNYVTIKPCPVG